MRTLEIVPFDAAEYLDKPESQPDLVNLREVAGFLTQRGPRPVVATNKITSK